MSGCSTPFFAELASIASWHQREDTEETVLMRLSADPLLIGQHIRANEHVMVSAESSKAGLAVALWLPGLNLPTEQSPNKARTLESPDTDTETSIRPEVFIATDEDIEMALVADAHGCPAGPVISGAHGPTAAILITAARALLVTVVVATLALSILLAH